VLLEERDPLGWVMKALREAGSSLMRQFAGLDEEALGHRPAEGELSLKEIACHLRDAEELAALQIASIVEEPGRAVPAWDVDVLVLERDYRAADMHRTLLEFRSLRNENTHILWTLSERDWRTPAKHPFRGEVTLEVIARELAQHDLEHLWQIQRLKAELGLVKAGTDDEWGDW
jgi:DinB superfamily